MDEEKLTDCFLFRIDGLLFSVSDFSLAAIGFEITCEDMVDDMSKGRVGVFFRWERGGGIGGIGW